MNNSIDASTDNTPFFDVLPKEITASIFSYAVSEPLLLVSARIGRKICLVCSLFKNILEQNALSPALKKTYDLARNLSNHCYECSLFPLDALEAFERLPLYFRGSTKCSDIFYAFYANNEAPFQAFKYTKKTIQLLSEEEEPAEDILLDSSPDIAKAYFKAHSNADHLIEELESLELTTNGVNHNFLQATPPLKIQYTSDTNGIHSVASLIGFTVYLKEGRIYYFETDVKANALRQILTKQSLTTRLFSKQIVHVKPFPLYTLNVQAIGAVNFGKTLLIRDINGLWSCNLDALNPKPHSFHSTYQKLHRWTYFICEMGATARRKTQKNIKLILKINLIVTFVCKLFYLWAISSRSVTFKAKALAQMSIAIFIILSVGSISLIFIGYLLNTGSKRAYQKVYGRYP